MWKSLIFSLLLTTLLSGCDSFKAWYATEFRQGDVTSGIARLSVQHLSMMTSEVSKKFKEADAKIEIVEDEDEKDLGKGTVTKTLENIELDFPNETIVYKDCLGTTASMHGKVKILRATQTIYGRLTKNPKNPVVPDPNSIKMTIHVMPSESIIRFSDKNDYLKLDKGEIIYDVYPRLAQSQVGNLKGLRVIPTSNNRFENVRFNNIHGTLFSEKVTLPFDISNSNYSVQVGRGENGDENKLEGEITAFGNTRMIPIDGTILNPDYDGQKFINTYSCNEGLEGQVEYNNIRFEEKLGPGMAGLTALAMSKIASRLADDSTCGMASGSFLRNTRVTGKEMGLGESEGELAGPCKINFAGYQTEPDCFGIAHEINGEAEVISATKHMKGLVFMSQKSFNNSIKVYERDLAKGDMTALSRKPEPVLPKSRQPAVIEFTANLSKLIVKEVCLNKGSADHENHCTKRDNTNDPMVFSLMSGNVTARLKPIMGKNMDPTDDRYKMCTVRSIPIAESEFRLQGVRAAIGKTGNEFRLSADGAYYTVSGKIGDRENELSGDVTIGKVPVAFRANNTGFIPLIPDYDANRYVDSYQSCSNNKFIVPASDDDCSMSELGL